MTTVNTAIFQKCEFYFLRILFAQWLKLPSIHTDCFINLNWPCQWQGNAILSSNTAQSTLHKLELPPRQQNPYFSKSMTWAYNSTKKYSIVPNIKIVHKSGNNKWYSQKYMKKSEAEHEQ